MMDWFTWLSKTGLNPALVYEYGLSFTHNELEEDDISYFDHEFLQSMGISIAKHRLEILKLAQKHRRRPRQPHRPGVLLPRGLLVAIKSTRRRFERYIKSWVRDKEHSPSSALVVVHYKDDDNYCRPSNGYFGTLLKRKKKTASADTAGSGDSGQAVMGRLLLTDGRICTTPARDLRIIGSSLCETESPVVNARTTRTTALRGKKKDEVEEGYWSAGVLEEIRWDSLFQDLKPT